MKTLKKFTLSTLAIAVALFAACTGEKNPEVNNNIDKVKEESATTTPHKLDPQWGIEDLVGMNGNDLVCKASNAQNFFYVLNKDFTLAKAFGVKGNAGNEWIMPHLLISEEKGKSYVIDNGTRKMFTLVNYNITSQKDSPVKGLLNGERAYKNLLCYQDMSPDKISLRIKDFGTGADCDSIVFEDPTHQGMSSKDDFVYDIRDGKLVLGKVSKDYIKICNISDNGKLELLCNINGTTKDKTTYYTSVAIANDKVCMLSQRNYEKGYSSIEVYDFDGNAVKNINLGFKASKIIFNPSDNSLIILESKCENIQTLKI